MQLEAPEDDNQDKRFSVYIDKTFRKTASLIAHSCQAVTQFIYFQNLYIL